MKQGIAKTTAVKTLQRPRKEGRLPLSANNKALVDKFLSELKEKRAEAKPRRVKKNIKTRSWKP